MIYTSYFGALKKIQAREDLCPISIARFAPRWVSGVKAYKSLAPTAEMLKMDLITYTARFFDILKAQDPEVVANDLRGMAAGKTPVLLCYEVYGHEMATAQKTMETAQRIGVMGNANSKVFCHRHFVARWFSKHGIESDELLEF